MRASPHFLFIIDQDVLHHFRRINPQQSEADDNRLTCSGGKTQPIIFHIIISLDHRTVAVEIVVSLSQIISQVRQIERLQFLCRALNFLRNPCDQIDQLNFTVSQFIFRCK